MKYVLALIVALAGPAAAEEQLSADAIREAVVGWTLHVEQGGVSYGAEEFHGDGGSLLQWRDGQCVAGAWRIVKRKICFAYEGQSDIICWTMHRDDAGDLLFRLVDETQALDLSVSRRDREQLICRGPTLGA